MVANALSQLIRDSSQVLVMGHKNSDMDAIGAAAGMVCAARVKGRPVHIVVDRQHTMASDLIERLETQSEYKGVFISAEDAMIACDFNTLLIVVDVNRPGYVEHCSNPSTRSQSSITIAVRRIISRTQSYPCTSRMRRPHPSWSASCCSILCRPAAFSPARRKPCWQVFIWIPRAL